MFFESKSFFSEEINRMLYLKIILGVVVAFLVAAVYIKNIRSELE